MNEEKPPDKQSTGRPRKFAEPSRPITVTLPESTLDALRQIHPDRGQAIVKLTQAALAQTANSPPLVEVVKMSAKTGMLVIGHCVALRRIPFLRLIEISPGRFLLALEHGNDFNTLELAIQDVLDDMPENDGREHELVVQLLQKMRALRKTERVSVAEILFVSLDEK